MLGQRQLNFKPKRILQPVDIAAAAGAAALLLLLYPCYSCGTGLLLLPLLIPLFHLFRALSVVVACRRWHCEHFAALSAAFA